MSLPLRGLFLPKSLDSVCYNMYMSKIRSTKVVESYSKLSIEYILHYHGQQLISKHPDWKHDVACCLLCPDGYRRQPLTSDGRFLVDSEEAARKFLSRHGFKSHKRLDDCDGCTRFAALMFIRDLPDAAVDKALLAEWVVSEEFYGSTTGVGSGVDIGGAFDAPVPSGAGGLS